MFVMLCNERSIATKCNGHLTFRCAIDYWGAHSNEGMCGAILSCNVVTCAFSSHNCDTKSKQTSSRNFKFDYGSKYKKAGKQGNS